MSKTIDEKVVQMRFDNSHFEANVAKTMKTLDQLKWKLKERDLCGDGLKSLGKAANNVDMSGLSRGIETVRTKFSALQVMGTTALVNLTNSAVNAGKRIASALGDALINGGKNRALNIQNAKFQIEGLLGTEEYNKQWSRIDESINWAVKDTAYGYDSAAKAASQFMASNVKVGEQMDYSLRAISGVAAMTNSTYDDIANVFTRVAGQGRVMAMDINSLAARGMNAAAVLGKALGKSEAEVREMVSDGKISFDMFAKAMDNAFGEHAKKGNETFSGALANMKAAMSRIGAKVWDPLLNNQRDVFNQMRLLINDLNNNYLNGPIDSLNNKLNSIFKNIVKFFELGGVKNILLGIGDILNYVSSVLKPVKEAFREIFPKKSVEELVEATKRFKEFTSKLKLSEESASKIKNTFKGLFSILDIGVEAIKSLASGLGKLLSHLTGVPGGVLGITSAMGQWLTKTRDNIKESKIFTNVVEGVVNMLGKFTERVKDFCSQFDIFGALVNGLKGVFKFIAQLGSEIGIFLGSILKAGNLEAGFNAINSVLNGGILFVLLEFVNQLKMLAMRSKEFVGNFSGTFYYLKETIASLQYSIKADALMGIAKALFVLAAAMLMLSFVDPAKLGGSLVALQIGILELVGALKLLSMFAMNFKSVMAITVLGGLIAQLSRSLVVLSVALKIMSTIDIAQMGVAILGMTVALGEMIAAMWLLPKDRDVTKSSKAIRKLATSLLILSAALKVMSTMSWDDIGRTLTVMTVTLAELVLAIRLLPKLDFGQRIAGITGACFALLILSGVLKILATMSWDDIWRSVTVMGIALAELVATLTILGNFGGRVGTGALALVPATLSLLALAGAMKSLSEMDWDDIWRSVTAMGIALAELTAAITIAGNLKGFTGSMALNGIIGALIPLAIALKMIGSMSVGQVATALITLATAFTILGVAGLLLGKIAPALLAVAGAVALFGLGAVAFGGGLMLMAAGITALAVALGGGVTIIVAGLSAIILGFINLIPAIIKAIGDGIIIICDCLIAATPKIAQTVLTIAVEILKALAKDGPLIVKYLAEFLIGVLNELKNYLPDFIQAAFGVIKAFLEGIGKALQGLDPILSLEGVLGLVGLTGLMYMLSGLGSLVGPAMIGVLALGALIAELALVLAAIGALAQIPGLKWLIEEGGNFMQAVGTAIGQFIGGIVGGVALGASAALPGIATNLSQFMQNLSPFIDGCRTIDGSVIVGAGIVAAAIIAMSASNFIYGITEFITFGSSLSDVGSQLSEFMKNAQGFLEGVKRVDPSILGGVAALAKAIILLTAADLLQGITKFITFGGSGDLGKFGEQLPPLAEAINGFANNLGTFGEDKIRSVHAACMVLQELAQAATQIPNEGGLWASIFGDNSIAAFGDKLPGVAKNLSAFIKNLGTFSEDKVATAKCACEVLKVLATSASEIPNTGGVASWFAGDNDIGTFGEKLPGVGEHIRGFVDSLGTFGEGQVETVKAACDALVALAKSAAEIPNSGGMVSWFTGDNDIGTFGEKLPGVGTHISQFVQNLGTFGDAQIQTADCAGRAIKMLAESASQIPNTGGIGSWFAGDNDISEFGGKLPGVGTNLSEFVRNLGTFGEDQIKTTDCAGRAIKMLAEAANQVPNIGGLVTWFAGDNDISTFAGKFPGIGSNLAGFVTNLGVFGEDQIRTVDAAGKAIKALAEAANQVPNTGGMVAWFTGDNDISTFASKFPGIGTNLSGFVKNLGTFGDDQIRTVDAGGKAIKALAEAANQIPNTGGLKSWFVGDNDISKFANKFWDVGSGLNAFIRAIGNFGGDQLKTVQYAVAALQEIVGLARVTSFDDKAPEKLKNITYVFWDVGSGIANFVKAQADISIDDVKAAAEKLRTIVNSIDLINNLKSDNLVNFQNCLKQIADDGVKIFYESINCENALGKSREAARAFIEAFINQANDKKGEVNSKFREVANEAYNGLNDSGVKSNIVNLGRNFVQGFANGINNNVYLARDAGSNVGRAALNAAKASIDAHSPSRETTKLGGFFGQGFVNGIIAFASKVYNASYNIGDKAKTGLNDAIAKISNVINSDIDTNPTIRPVLDLSNVQSGVGALNSMLGSTSIGVRNNLSAISSGMNGRNQNGNSDVVSALNKLRKDLGNVKGDTYNVNGVSYDDGSEVSNAVKTLIRAAKVERRK